MARVAVAVKWSLFVALVAAGWRYYQSYNYRRLPPVVEGFFLPEFRPVAELFRQYVEDGTECGGSFAVYRNGERLVDLWGGYADPDSRRPWREDTVVMMWSSTKGPSALAIATLVNRGLMDYKAKIHQYWPEFAQNGKENITVEMLLSHQAGLASLGGKSISLQEYKKDWKKVETLLAAAHPDFPPGSQVFYQSFTLSMYIDALIRRVDPLHRNLSQYFKEEIAEPFGIDFHIGLPLHQFHRAARQFFVRPWEWLTMLFDSTHRQLVLSLAVKPGSLFFQASRVLDFFMTKVEILNDPQQMEVGVGSFMGFGTARSLAKMYDILANGGRYRGKMLVNASLVERFQAPLTLSLPSELESMHLDPFSLGFQVSTNAVGGQVFGHSGYGGQQARADPHRHLGIAYATNFHWARNMRPVAHYLHLERVFYECLEKIQRKT